MRIITLKRRAEFVRVRGGGRWSTQALVLEAKPRGDLREEEGGLVDDPRFGFTVTKKIGGAVVRNRVRRRLKAAVRDLSPGLARPGYDYVLIARAGAVSCPFTHLQHDLAAALGRVHRMRPQVAGGASGGTQPLAAKPGQVRAGRKSGAGRRN